MLRDRLPLAACLLLALVSCAELGSRREQHVTDLMPSDGLAATQPGDVAVPAVRDQSEAGGAPVQTLRRAIYRGLVTRLYSPVDLEYLDKGWTEASFGDEAVADAILQVAVIEWDESFLDARGVVIASAEARLHDARDLSGKPLWGVTVTRRIDLTGLPEDGDHRVWAAERLATEILAQLPERDAVRAPRTDA